MGGRVEGGFGAAEAARLAQEAARRAAEEAARRAEEAARQAAAAARQPVDTRRYASTFEAAGQKSPLKISEQGGAPSTSLLTEDTRDGQVNCLDLAADFINKSSPTIQAKSELVFLKDSRPGAEGQSGHVVVRQGQRVLDPGTGKSYEDMKAYLKEQPQYSEAGSIKGTTAAKVFATKPGSPERAEALANAKISPELQQMLVADSPAETAAWDKYAEHVKNGPPKASDLNNRYLIQEANDDYNQKTKELAESASAASVARLREEVEQTPEGKRTFGLLEKRGVQIQVLDDKEYAALPGAQKDGHASPGSGPIYIPRSQATKENLLRLAQSSAEAQPLSFPKTDEDGKKIAGAIAQKVDANPKVPVEFSVDGVTVLAMKDPQPSIVSASGKTNFTDTAKAQGAQPGNDTIVNMSFYKALAGGLIADGGTPVGQVIQDGKVIAGGSEPDRFFAAWTPSGVKFGKGNPPPDSKVGFGGAVPLIINNLPYGDGNKYDSGVPEGAPKTGDPEARYASHLTQKNNNGFISQEEREASTGKVIIGYDRDTGTQYVIVQKDGASPGKKMSEIRDTLIKLGVDDAVSFDGSDSATLVRDDQVAVKPGKRKNDDIPYGLDLKLA
ncbi:phosphodiester glycosidase family protein [Pyxidicoccus caerfyrddinensis]|uniref:phosphodiester glycosidase family protein n=1 Tax=Pyxidicoccus caerfyrddinensis TaxID=2709663 RepID=UPI0013D921FB|nr:phosphodiester glycosidase family protein [Pyxidicoccus caerfyrddinensis]